MHYIFHHDTVELQINELMYYQNLEIHPVKRIIVWKRKLSQTYMNIWINKANEKCGGMYTINP